MTSSTRIILGLAAGVAVGLFFGEKAAVLDWAADGFVKLLQMTVLPYVTVSILTSLGRLDYAQARSLGLRVGGVVAGLWVVALGFAFAIPWTFPDVENASFFSTTLVERRAAFDFVSLYIPANPFHSLAFNVVPAVVLFSALLGVALIGVEQKQALLDVLKVVADAVSRATRFVAALTPYGLFAIAATTAGTLNLDQLGRIQVYLLTYIVVALLLSLWVLPGLIATLTPVPYGAVLRTTHTALITAFVAGDLFIVLPSLIEASKTLMQQYGSPSPDTATLPDVIVPASFNFPHSGKLLSLSFILFAGWFADASVPVSQYGQLAASGLVTFFGSLNAAIPFLLDLFRIPADMFQLFIATGVVNSRFGTLVAAVHTVTVAILGTAAMTGMLAWERRRVLRYVVTTAIASVVAIGGVRTLFASILDTEYRKDDLLTDMRLVESAPIVADDGGTAADVAAGMTTLEAIRARRSVRVCYLSDSLPFAFVNGHGDLVGFDMALAHRLAIELGVSLQLILAHRDDLEALVDRGQCDLAMSGVVVTTNRAGQMLFSTSYLDETLGVMVPDHARDRFRSWSDIDALGAVTIGVPDVPYFMQKLRALLPRAQLRPLHSVDDVFSADSGLAAVALPAERGSAWTLLHPQYSMIVPEGALVKVPLAYPIARHDAAFAAFINTWIDLKHKDGTIDREFKYWILGQHAVPTPPRWAFARDVLHWID